MMEFDTYKAVYCGLCKQLGKAFGPMARMTLSYDFAFLSLLSLGVSEQTPCFARQSCAANPLKKKPCLCICTDSRFAADAAMLMFYYKVWDNYYDSGFFGKLKSLLLLPFAGRWHKKAKKHAPEMDAIIARAMEDQRAAEQQSRGIDASAEPSARALAEIAALIPANETDKLVLNRIGYLIGRWVYLIDALDDLEDDLKNGSFNPFLRKFGLTEPDADLTEAKKYAVGMLQLTAGDLSNTYELLSLNRYKTILDNLIYLGLKSSMEQVLQTEKNKKKRKKPEKEIFG